MDKSYDMIGISNDNINAKDFTELEHFQKFIKNNDIKNNNDLRIRFTKVHSRLRYLGFNNYVKYTGKIRESHKDLNTKEDFHKFIDENSIENYSDFMSRFPKVYSAMVNKISAKEIVYKNPIKYERENKLDSVESFQKFINDNNITSPKIFRENYKTEYKWAQNAGILRRGNRLVSFVGWIDTSKLNTIEDFKEFVKNNNVKNVADMLDRFPAVDKRMRVLKIKSKEIGYSDLKIQNENLDEYTFDFIQNYIIDNKIVYLEEIRKSNMSMYAKILRNKWDSRLEFPLRKDPNPELKKYNTVEDFQKLIDSNEDIISPIHFIKKFPDIYSRLNYLKLSDSVIYRGRIKKAQSNELLESINTYDEFQKFIEDNDISSPREFQSRFFNLYRKSLLLNNSLNYKNYNMSLPEKVVNNLLTDLKINNIKQKTFSWLVNDKTMCSMRLDFYLPDFSTAIEVQGEQHFVPIDYFGGEDEFIETIYRDFLKNKLCCKNNINLIYFYEPSLTNNPQTRSTILTESIPNYFSTVIVGKENLINNLDDMINDKE